MNVIFGPILIANRQHLVRNPPSIQQASSSSASSPVLSPPGKTLGRNHNGTSKSIVHTANNEATFIASLFFSLISYLYVREK